MHKPVIKVILIGGAPGAGKTTLGTALAMKLGVTSLSIDDLMVGCQAVTTPHTHPGLHVMRMVPYLDYFTNNSLDKHKKDAAVQHEATWPIVERVIRKHATHGSGIVIDGWHLRPNYVAQLDLENVLPVWIIAEPSVLEDRERGNQEWLQGSTDPDRMLENFIARSLWYNDLIKKEANKLGMHILTQTGTVSVDQLCSEVIEKISAS